jgi:uncharacterized protein YggE
MEESKTKLFKALTIMVVFGALLLATKIVTEIKEYRFIGGGVSATNMISVSGEGEVFASPDIATVSFVVREEAKKVVDAQSKVSTKVNAALVGVRKLGVLDKDIKTANYSSYPKYEYQQMKIECTGYCPPEGKQVLTGYEVSQAVIVTVRNLDDASAIVDVLAQAGATETQGPNFAIDNEDKLKTEVRGQAIEKARAKAKVLADDLGVSLVRVVSFSEDGGYPYYPEEMAVFSKDARGGGVVAPLPEIPQGQEKIISRVTVTYEIR